MTEQLMQDNAATQSGDAASQTPLTAEAASNALYGDKQQAPQDKTQQAQDSASADQSKGGEEGKPEAADKPQGAPETYEFKPPEGNEYNPEFVKVYSEAARELNLPQEAAQKMLDKVVPTILQQQAQQIEAVKTQWADSSRADKEFGGEKIAENLAVAKKALDQFGTPELRTLLEQSGLGNNPEVIRFMFRAGKAISEDKYVGPSAGAGAKPMPKDFSGLASALYSNQSTQ